MERSPKLKEEKYLPKKPEGKQFRRKFLAAFLSLLGTTAPIWGFLVALVSILGTGFALREKIPIFEGIYFAFITAMTIGYGDITPTTHLGMIISVVIGMIGLVATGIVAALAFQAVKIAFESVYHNDPDNDNKFRK